MTKFRKKALSGLTLLFALLIGVCALTACKSKDYSVTFMVDGKQYEQVSVENGSVTLPQEPSKEYYIFRNWYTTEDFKEGTEFKNSGIKENLTVYARFVAKEVTVHYGMESEVIELKDIDSAQAEYENKAAEKNLTFDGWYTNASYTVKYSVGADVTDLYAREMAKVTYYNGYQNVYELLVTPDEKTTQPTADDVKKFYMSDDYFFCDYADSKVVTDSEGYPVLHDFDSAVTANQTVYVMWSTPNLQYKLNEKSNNYYVSGFDTALNNNNYTAASFPSYITVDGTVRKVDVVNAGQYLMQYLQDAEKLIVNEGIKGIIDLGGSLNLKIKEVSLPASLKIIENSFNSFGKLTSVELPKGLEVLIDSFWSEYCSFVVNSYRETKYNFDIEIPASVTNMATVPANLTFADGSAFGKENGVIYKTVNTKKIYVDGRSVGYQDGRLVIPDGYEGIQVGATKGLELEYLTIPSSWSFVSYNNDRNDYEWYNAGAGSSSLSDKLATDKTQLSAAAISIFSGLSSVRTVAIKQSDYPAGIAEYAIMGIENGTYRNYDYSGYESKVVFVGEIAEGEAVKVNVTAINRMSDEKITASVKDVVSGDKITAEQIKSALGLAELSYKTVVESYSQFGEDYDFNNVVDRNLYIDVVFSFDALGFTYEENNGELTVTGFDKDTAQYLEDSNTYLVAIPSELNGKNITSIQKGAFKGVNNISAVYIPATVKEIGDEAFMNTTNLTSVNIVKGGLEVIGRSAFENSGFESIALPLTNIKEIKPYAFKSAALKEFIAVEGEEDRTILTYNFSGDGIDKVYPGLTSGQFFFVNNNDDGVNHGIVKFIEKKVEKQLTDTTSKEQIDVDVYDVQYVATAGAFEARYFTVGWSYRKNLGFGCKSVIRYEMMEGSVYYLNNIATGITFGVVSKIHKDAFTDIAKNISEISVNNAGNEYSHIFYYIIEVDKYNMYNNYDKWLTPEQITSIGSKDYDFAAADALFEDGWFNGITVNDADYETKMKFMGIAKLNDSILGM